MGQQCSRCQDEQELDAPTREEALAFAFEVLKEADSEALQGRTAEAGTLNGIAQAAMALADRSATGDVTTLTGGPH